MRTQPNLEEERESHIWSRRSQRANNLTSSFPMYFIAAATNVPSSPLPPPFLYVNTPFCVCGRERKIGRKRGRKRERKINKKVEGREREREKERERD